MKATVNDKKDNSVMESQVIYRVGGHIFTVFRHKWYVLYYCCKAGLIWQGIVHDLSKFSWEELVPGVKYYSGVGSPNSIQKAYEGYSSAWLHHKSRNKHHYEYWLDYDAELFQKNGEMISPIKMPTRYLVEMFCDRVAACRVYNGKNYRDSDPYIYYKDRAERMIIHKETRKELVRLLKILSLYGERRAFVYARKLLKSDKRRRCATGVAQMKKQGKASS